MAPTDTPRTPAGFPAHAFWIERVLQHSGDRTVVFGRDEEETARGGDLRLQTLHGLRWLSVVVLVVKR
jgi:hypothetical protein